MCLLDQRGESIAQRVDAVVVRVHNVGKNILGLAVDGMAIQPEVPRRAGAVRVNDDPFIAAKVTDALNDAVRPLLDALHPRKAIPLQIADRLGFGAIRP